jgi:hypothetical protein
MNIVIQCNYCGKELKITDAVYNFDQVLIDVEKCECENEST